MIKSPGNFNNSYKKPVETQRTSTAPEAYRFLEEGKSAPNLKQIRAALSFAYKHWDVKNPFAKIDPPLQKEPRIRYLLLADVRRLLDYLKVWQQGYGSALVFHLANALFQTACRFDELIQLKWGDCQAVGKEIVALHQGEGERLPGCAGYRRLEPGAPRVEGNPGKLQRQENPCARRDRLRGIAVCVCGIVEEAKIFLDLATRPRLLTLSIWTFDHLQPQCRFRRRSRRQRF
jgi:integrase